MIFIFTLVFSFLRKTLIKSVLDNEKRNLLPDIWKAQVIGIF